MGEEKWTEENKELEIKDSCFTLRVRNLFGVTCVTIKALLQKRGFGRGQETDGMEDPPWWNQGACTYCLIAAIEEKGGEELQFRPEQEEEENVTRGQGTRAQPHCRLWRPDKNLLWGSSVIALLCLQTFSENCYTPNLRGSKTLGNKARERLCQVPGVAGKGSRVQGLSGKVKATAEKQPCAWLTQSRDQPILFKSSRGRCPGRGRQSPEPSVLLKMGCPWSRHMGHKCIALSSYIFFISANGPETHAPQNPIAALRWFLVTHSLPHRS